MRYYVYILLIFFLAQCSSKQSADLCPIPEYVIDTAHFEHVEGILLKNYYGNGVVDFVRLYEDSVQKDLCRFYPDGKIDQYVFFNEDCDCPRFVINYDSSGCDIDTFDGKPAYFKSDVFGKTVQEGQPYSVYVYSATPPKMNLNLRLFYSSNEKDWEYFGEKGFANGKNSVVIADTVSKAQQYFMGICSLKSADTKKVLKTDTLHYSLNIK